MANLKLSIVLFAVAAFGTVASQKLIAPRLINGVPIDTLRRFPHHVTIEREFSGEYWASDMPFCGGSILNEQWILTSKGCVDQCSRLHLHFEKLYSNSTTGSYSVLVNCDTVHIYPTNHDDIALVKIPVRMVYSDTISPVSISSTPAAQLENKLVVLPGYDAEALHDYSLSPTSPKQQLTYAMLKIISNNRCKEGLKDWPFDEYLQLCTEGWGNNPNTPCVTDYGSGLIVGWPAKPEIVGIYSGSSYDCDSYTPSIYTNVAKYKSWIDSVIKGY